jgi:hypothetical protein
MQVEYVRVYADAEGESHIEDIAAELSLVDPGPSMPPLNLSAPWAATQAFVLHLPPGWDGPPHVSPQRQLCVNLAGELQIGVSDGEVRTFGPGAMLLFEDTVGKGHSSRNSGGGEFVMLITYLSEGEEA